MNRLNHLALSLSLRFQINQITENDLNSIPIYVLNDLCKETNSLESCQLIISLLFKRLETKEMAIISKVLKSFKYICQNGHVQFKCELRKQSTPIKEFLTYRGHIDPLHGESISISIRTLAQEVLEIIFSDTQTPIHHISNSSSRNSVSSQSFVYEDPAVVKTVKVSLNAIYEIVENYGIKIPSGSNNNQDDYQNESYNPPNNSVHTDKSVSHSHNNQNSEKDTFTPTMERVGGIQIWGGEKSKIQREEPGAYEERLVDEIVSCGGIVVRPSKVAIKDFCSKIAPLDIDVVFSIIESKLHNSTNSWQLKLKTLCLIEGLVSMGGDLEVKTRDYFEKNPFSILAQSNVVQTSLKNQAEKTIKLLGIQNVEYNSQSESQSHVQSNNLLDYSTVETNQQNQSDDLLNISTIETNQSSSAFSFINSSS